MNRYVIIDPNDGSAEYTCGTSKSSLAECPEYFMEVGNRRPSNQPNFYSENGSTYTDNEYDAHYLAGNLYQWNAATAGTGGTITEGEAAGSICPKGWKLPTYSGDYSFSTLTGTKSRWTTATYNGNSGVPGYYFGSTKTTVYKSANFWPAAGLVYQSSGTLANAGSYGGYWPRRAYYDTNNAYYLYFGSSDVRPQNFSLRYYGFSVRCVATY